MCAVCFEWGGLITEIQTNTNKTKYKILERIILERPKAAIGQTVESKLKSISRRSCTEHR